MDFSSSRNSSDSERKMMSPTGTVSFMNESKLQSSFSFNYPSKDPAFYIPKVPELTKVPDPKPPKKAPLAGYDMRTLRKQIDYLQSEIEDRTETQQLLYRQNEELWGYSRSLLECNKTNAVLMKNQVKTLHDELRNLHQERLILTTKLESAENSKELLLQMGVELSGARGAATNAHQLALDAEHALTSIRFENEEREKDLSDQVDRMRDAHRELDGLRERHLEDSAVEVAEMHWKHSRATLKVAYSRFRKGIARRVKLANIFTLFSNFLVSFLRQKVWHLWTGYLRRNRVMHRNDRKRSKELLTLLLHRWKEYSTQQQISNSGRRRILLKRMLVTWKLAVKKALWDAKADDTVTIFQNRQKARAVFRAWRDQVMFLEWESEPLLVLGRFAVRYYAGKVMRAWLAAAVAQREEIFDRVARVPMALSVRPFRAWLALCRGLWRRRGDLLRRFFVHAGRLVMLRSVMNHE